MRLSPPTRRARARALAEWWDAHKSELRKSLLKVTHTARQGLTKSYRQRLQRLHNRLDDALRGTGARDGATTQTGTSTAAPTATEVRALREQVAACRSAWQLRKRDILLWKHAYDPQETSKRFFERVSTKFQDNTIFSLDGKAGCGPRRSEELAEDIADGWVGVMQGHDPDSLAIEQFLARVPPRCRMDDKSLVAEITEAEVAAAIKRCKRDKASGPDKLGNSLYRDHVDDLAPILAGFFNAWMDGGVFPTSFGDATIHCLKKTSGAARPLDHRLITLLNSDYKIFTKILSFRLRPILPLIVDPAQAGFVPGRSIESTIDVLDAARAYARNDAEHFNAVALLLDFAKAYDLLLRRFLLLSLDRLGFSHRFVTIVRLLHENTSCRFQVNGFLSRKASVTCGIRQGCPLAPLLFILALDGLYRVLRHQDGIDGVRIASATQEDEIRIAGYADDTAVYLSHYRHIKPTLAVLEDFAAVSGLRTNLSKSVVPPLGDCPALTTSETGGMSLLQPDAHCRYLGILVGRRDATSANWSACFRSLELRLVLARKKTHSAEQRAQIARAVIIPKMLYVARHSWPSSDAVEASHRLIKDFIWGVWRGKRARAWVPEEQSEPDISSGGLAVPNIRTELITMSAMVVGRWATNATSRERLVGDVIHAGRGSKPNFITLASSNGRAPRVLRTLWETGREAVGMAATAHAEGDTEATITARAARFITANTGDHHDDGSYTVNVTTAMNDATTKEMRTVARVLGDFSGE